ncbi:site-specific DNA-methyltransferase [Proteiniborus sp.]|uniref:site-specific DNA-methyltransferase n=1 Tax=Proteiniborus sp. TaxID=2079015 RepID=UPI00332F143E
MNIDPPYNTGKDFVYKDNFTQDKNEYLEESGQADEEGNRLFLNTDSNGRYHSDWLTMMYPRLKLARNLLSEDGVIFISIDDNEVHNLRKICDEVFGERNFTANIVWRKKTGASDSTDISVITEDILVYKKNINCNIFSRDTNAYDEDRYRLTDEYVKERGKHYIDNLDRGGIRYSDSLNYPIQCPDGTITYPNGRTEFKNDGWIWTWGKEKLEWGIKHGFITFKKSSNKESGWGVYYKNYLKVDNTNTPIIKSLPFKNIIFDIINTEGTKEIREIFESKVFQYTKPSSLIKYLINLIKMNGNDIILDFFSGSATTAHAVMQLNAEDSGNRKYIMVQLPEETDEKSEAYKAGYKTIAEIGKERIRRAAKKIKEETNLSLDYGFRVFKVDSSNMKDVYYLPNELTQMNLHDLTENIKEDRTGLDLLSQVILESGLELSLPMETKIINGKEVHFVDEDALIACFDKNIDETLIREIAKEKPLKAIFRDNSFKDCPSRINLEEIFKSLSPNTEIKVL